MSEQKETKHTIKFRLPFDVEYFYNKDSFYDNDVTRDEVLKYLRGLFNTKQKFMDEFITPIGDAPFIGDLLKWFVENFDNATIFTYEEAFKLTDERFRALVFGTIDITDMINSLGNTRIKTEGIPVKRKQYDNQGNFLGFKEYDNIYETYEVHGGKLGLDSSVYAVKCWCTSTNKEHWIWIDEQYKNSPLDAIASTFRIHENVIPHIKELKRQGDIMLVELNEEVNPEGNVVALTKDQYFGLLTAES
jgi:hypothetical protein